MKRMRALLGTYVEISAEHEDAGLLGATIDQAFAAVEQVHRLMSVHCPGSDLSRINRVAWRRPVEVHPWTARTLRWAERLNAATGGLFDCAVGHELGRYGLVAGCFFDTAESGSLGDLEVSADNEVRLARRVALDLGGLAKGFAVDRAIARLRGSGVRQAVVNAGGDLRTIGTPQPIHVRLPAGGVRLAGVLSNGAIATSGTQAVVDVGGRRPLAGEALYSVVAPSCVVADGLTKAVAQSGRLDAPWLAAFGASAFVTRAPTGGAAPVG